MNYNGETILSKLAYYANHTPDKVCLIDAIRNDTITYSEFWSKILRFANSVIPGKFYILRTRQTIEHLIAFYGVQAGGASAIPVEAAASDDRIKELSIQFGSEILPVDYRLGREEQDFNNPNSESIACVICTTGTTGKSKGVLSSFRCRFCGADNVRYSYEITANDIALVPQVLSHSGGLRRVEAMLVSGATAVIMGAAMMFGNVFGAIRRYRCNILQFVPAQIAQILARAEKMLVEVAPQLRIVSVGSSVISEHDKERLRELLPNVRLFNDFGSTEAIGSAYFEWSAYPPKPDCIGKASLHSSIVLLSDDGGVMEDTSRDRPGIIATEGGTLMSGYLNDPDLTQEAMRDSRVVSADLGYRDTDGLIYIIGRKDDMIVSGANKISPTEIENVVLSIKGIKECACVPKSDAIMGQMPALFVVIDGENMDVNYIVEIMEEKLERFKVPRPENIYFIDAIPRTVGTGKVIKNKLQERFIHENI